VRKPENIFKKGIDVGRSMVQKPNPYSQEFVHWDSGRTAEEVGLLKEKPGIGKKVTIFKKRA
jgi:hypothetical protein